MSMVQREDLHLHEEPALYRKDQFLAVPQPLGHREGGQGIKPKRWHSERFAKVFGQKEQQSENGGGVMPLLGCSGCIQRSSGRAVEGALGCKFIREGGDACGCVIVKFSSAGRGGPGIFSA